jgi:hypothetical protein
MSTDYRGRIDQELGCLGPDVQQKVLEYIRSLKKSGEARAIVGTAGTAITSFAGTILVADLQAIENAIEQGCRRVDLNEW